MFILFVKAGFELITGICLAAPAPDRAGSVNGQHGEASSDGGKMFDRSYPGLT
jgi:hypothetical protein